MSAGLAVKHNQPRHLNLGVHEEQPTISCREQKAIPNDLGKDEDINKEIVRQGCFLFGHSTRKDEEELDLSECTSEESIPTPEMGEELEKIQKEELQETDEEIDIQSNPKLAKKFEEELRRRLIEEQRDSDLRWIAHEKEQIKHLQDSHEFMLKFLHKEVERFQGLYKDAKRPVLVIPENDDVKELKGKIKLYEEAIKQLEEQLRLKDEQAASVEETVKLTVDRLKEQNDIQADRIRQLSSELNDRNQTVAHLSNQLRNYRLRDAMATAQQRRRASQGSPIPSPVSPIKPLPSKGVVSSSVSVTYPGSKSMHMSMSSPREFIERPGSIERPPRRRASSGFGK